ncbi:hypothetical protein B0T45_23170 [Chromobacterium haemolyticum]|uniref:Uncharacterized protein n=1 Tax=Chromobacterium haemolyticum TaxID=394935 RepID=A0A1W0C918_9NEIS|nr:hypothetical protein B0T45_23170 [Chromobacterium haemolyticum]
MKIQQVNMVVKACNLFEGSSHTRLRRHLIEFGFILDCTFSMPSLEKHRELYPAVSRQLLEAML